ncbi:MAG: tetratricopeptide repeat protein [Acidobacteria bacterium]|nr:tetratricopeptide repeat protein [Acidobacteriota bacterium]
MFNRRAALTGFNPLLCSLILLGIILTASGDARAQDTASPERQRAMKLFEANNMTEALPLLEKLAEASPSDVVVLERLGWALLANSSQLKDQEARKKMRFRARAVLLRAQELGDNSNLLKLAMETLNSADATDVPFSGDREADAAMREGEALYAKGRLGEAAQAYERALRLDPKLYEAALFAGDMYFKLKQWDQAGGWFARAVAINPNRETAHRYWGDALIGHNQQKEALDKFIEAIVAEPFNRRAYMGLSQWGELNRVRLGHPKIDIPTSVTPLKDNKMTINLDPKMLAGDDSDGKGSWMLYGLVRAAWATSDFAKAFPQEKTYRHSLREEAEALRGVAQAVRQRQKDGKIKDLDPSLANLLKLEEAGLLEAYIIFARPDEGIARDYEAYRQANRDKLRRYWSEVVVLDKKF